MWQLRAASRAYLAGRPWTKQQFIVEIQKVMVTLGLPDHEYAGHSFQIGAATSAALAGVEGSTIQLLSHWQSASFLCNIRTPQETLAYISAILAAQAHGDPTRPQTNSCHIMCVGKCAIILVRVS